MEKKDKKRRKLLVEIISDRAFLLSESSIIFKKYFFDSFTYSLGLLLMYLKVVCSNTSCLEPHPGFYRLLMKGIFDGYVL